MIRLIAFFVVTLFHLSIVNCEDINVEHSFDGRRTWSSRGQLQTDLPFSSSGLKFNSKERAKLSHTEIASLKTLSQRNDNYYVRIKIGNNELLSSCRACSLLKSNFNDQIILGISKNLSIISFDYIPQTYQCDSAPKIDTSPEFKTILSSILPSSGVAPLKEEVQKPKQEENTSFLARYWMYIVPVVLISIIQIAAGVADKVE